MKKFSSITRVSSRRTSPIKKRIGATIIVGAFLLFFLWLVPQLFSGIASLVLTPIQATKTWLFESSANLPMYFRDRTELIAENERLREELAIEQDREYSYTRLQKENTELRALLGNDEVERVLAGVIGRPNRLPYDVIVIDRGSLHGIREDAPVFIGGDTAIGMVTRVFPDAAIVELATTPGLVSSVYIVGPDVFTNAVGIGGGQLEIGIPQGISVNEGDEVIMPGVSTGIYGTIEHIVSLPTEPEQYAYVSSALPLQSIRHVAVGRTPLAPVSFEEAQETVSAALTEMFPVPVPEGVLVVTGHSTTSTSTAATSTPTITDIE